MHGAILSYGLLGVLAIALVVAAATDIKRRQIDNWLNAAIALGAPIFWWSCHLSFGAIVWQLGVAAATFVVLALLFILRAMGGGDVKLLTALALWIRPISFLHLVTITALAGGALTIAVVFVRLWRKPKAPLAVPYGVAIALGGFWVLGFEYWPLVRVGAAVC